MKSFLSCVSCGISICVAIFCALTTAKPVQQGDGNEEGLDSSVGNFYDNDGNLATVYLNGYDPIELYIKPDGTLAHRDFSP